MVMSNKIYEWGNNERNIFFRDDSCQLCTNCSYERMIRYNVHTRHMSWRLEIDVITLLTYPQPTTISCKMVRRRFFFSFPWNTKLSQKRSCERKVGIFFPSWKKNNVCHEYSRHWDRKKDLFLISAFNIDLTWYKRFTRWILFVRGMKITSKLLVNDRIGWKMVAVLHKRYHNSSLASKDSLIISYFFETKHSNYHRNRNLIILNHNDCVIRCCFGFH